MSNGVAPKLRVSGPIRVTIPAKVAYKPDALKKTIGNVLERIGCPNCFSGADCFFQMERDLIVDESQKIAPVAGPSPQPWRVAGPVPDPWRVAGPGPQPWQVTVGLSSRVKYDINKVFEAVDKVIDILGHHPCISGFDILVQDELRTIVVNEQLQASKFDARF